MLPAPPHWELDEVPGHDLLKRSRPGIAVASVLIPIALCVFSEPEGRLFSLRDDDSLLHSSLSLSDSLFVISSDCTFISLFWSFFEPGSFSDFS